LRKEYLELHKNREPKGWITKPKAGSGNGVLREGLQAPRHQL